MDDVVTRLEGIGADLPAWFATGTRRAPSASTELGLIGEPAVVARLSTEDRRRRSAVRIRILVAALLGESLTLEHAETLAADRLAVVRMLAVRRDVYAQMRDFGRLELACPTCSQRRSMSLGEVVSTVGVAPPSIADADGEPVLPSLATFMMRGARPVGLPEPARLELSLPAAIAGVESPARTAELGPPLTPAGDAAAQRRWARDEAVADPALIHRRSASPGFRTLLRVMQLCRRIDETSEVTLDLVESLVVVDVLFIDAVHHVLYATDVLDVDRASLPCLACGVRYGLVR